MIATHQALIREGRKKRKQRIEQWTRMKENAIYFFRNMSDEWAIEAGDLPRISIIDSQEVSPDDRSPASLQISFSKIKTGFDALEPENGTAIETGCALVIAQDVYGTVICTIFPAKSALHEWKKKYIIIRFYRKPSELTEIELEKVSRIFLAWQQYTSINGTLRIIDRIRVICSRVQDWRINIINPRKFRWLIEKVVYRVISQGMK